MLSYQEYRYYSLVHDADVARLSMFDKDRQEFFATVPTRNGRQWRAVRNAVLDQIEECMNAGYDPGEVEIDEDRVDAAVLEAEASRAAQEAVFESQWTNEA
jgi:hypothetical protein